MDHKRPGRILIHISLSILVITLAVAVAYRLILSRPEVKRTPPKKAIPRVGVVEAEVGDVTIVVNGEGTVRPSKVVDLVPQVSGEVVAISPNLVGGGRFRKGEVLIKIEDRDYRLTLIREEAEVKTQESRLKELLEESEAARKEWEMVNPSEEPPPLLLKLPEIEATRAALEAARARVEKARLDLERTEIRAPFDGIVLSEDVDIGEYVRAGEKLATLFSIDEVEIEVPIALRDGVFLEIPGFNADKGSEVEVYLETGRPQKWKGFVSRALVVDEKTRTLPVIVTVKRPYDRMPPLAVGNFVKVRIKGKALKKATMLKEGAVRWTEEGRPFVWIVDDGRLKKRYVEVEKAMDGLLVIKGLKGGEKVVTSMAGIAVEGMEVRTYMERR